MSKLRSAIYAFDAIKDSSARHGGRYASAIRRFAHLYQRRHFSPYEIYFYDLLDPRISDEVLKSLMSREEVIAVDNRYVLDTYLCVTADKAVFYSLCLAAGAPVPRLLAVFDIPVGWTPDGGLLASRSDWIALIRSLPREFVIKPALGLLGKGVTAFRRETDIFLDNNGDRRNPDELYGFLCDNKQQNLFASDFSHHSLRIPGKNHKSIIQERVYAHPEIAELTGSNSVSTCRLITRRDRSGVSQVLATAIKIIDGENLVDNFDKGTKGNLWCNVDLSTGQIVEAFIKGKGDHRLERITQHPTTRRNVVGFRIPQWEETLQLAHHLATVFSPQPLIHWDIGVTTAGPMVIEGNVGGQTMVTPLNRPVRTLLAEA